MLKKQLRRAYHRALREISKIPLLKHYSETAYQASIESFSHHLLSFDPIDAPVVDGLEREGIFVTNLPDLKLQATAEMLQGVRCIVPQLSTHSSCAKGDFKIKAASEQLLEHPALFLWGLEERLLRITENYLKLPVAYHGVYLRRDLANGVCQLSRQWHLDKEDRRMLKIIVYLNDVDEAGGCLQYIPDKFTSTIRQALHYDYGRVADQQMARVFPASQWRSCVGMAGTVIFFDPARLFHRGKVPIQADRYTLFFDYTSRIPQHSYYCKSSFALHELLVLAEQFSAYQRDSVFWNQKLAAVYQRSRESAASQS